MKQGVIKQVREEMQGYDLMLLNLELKRLKLKRSEVVMVRGR